MWIRNLLFTLSSVVIIIFQYYIFTKNIEILKIENQKLSNQIRLGYKKHLDVVKQIKEENLEANAIAASYEYTSYSYSEEEKSLPKINEDFRKGFTEGYQKSLRDQEFSIK